MVSLAEVVQYHLPYPHPASSPSYTTRWGQEGGGVICERVPRAGGGVLGGVDTVPNC